MKITCAICKNELNMGVTRIVRTKGKDWVCRECLKKANLSVMASQGKTAEEISARINNISENNVDAYSAHPTKMGLFDLFKKNKTQPNGENYINSTLSSVMQELSKKSDKNVMMENFDNLEGLEFENWCANLLRNNGFINVKVTRASGDQGVDILAEKGEIKYAIQCKCYSSDLGNSPIQEVHAGKSMYNCHVGAVMTNRHFTNGAKELAKATGVLLWDREKLLQMQSNGEGSENNYILGKGLDTDPVLLDAIDLALAEGKISTTLLQRNLMIGFGRAAKLIDKMEELGIVSPSDGQKPRKVLMSKDDVIKMIMK